MDMTRKNILVVDDEPKIRQLLRNCFELEGFRVFEAEDSAEIDRCMDQHEMDLITLDLNLGAENGLAIASALKTKSDVPIIIVTGKGDVIDRVVGLEMGADDYISKPFHVREVIARVRSVLRRTEAGAAQRIENTAVNHEVAGVPGENRYTFDEWIADLDKLELTSPCGRLCELTTADFKLLKVLLDNSKRVLSREQIMDQVNGHDWVPYDRTIDNQVARLRKKLESDPKKPNLIKTVRGIGYMFTADVAKL